MRPGTVIVAIASPPGPAPRGVVRLAGPGTLELAKPFVRVRGWSVGASEGAEAPGSPRGAGSPERARTPLPEARRGLYPAVVEGLPGLAGPLPCLAIVFREPQSYTGEDALELIVPGAPALLDALVGGLLAAGAEQGRPVAMAEPGEFTARAWMRGRLSLAEAEAVGAVIEATGAAQHAAARSLAGGTLARTVASALDDVVSILARLEAGIDFSDEEDVVAITAREVQAEVQAVIARLVSVRDGGRAAGGARGADRARDVDDASEAAGVDGERGVGDADDSGDSDGVSGARTASGVDGTAVRVLDRPRFGRESVDPRPLVVLAGAPNAGKTTLFNCLLGGSVGIVSDRAGTTRDVLEASWTIQGDGLDPVSGSESQPESRQGFGGGSGISVRLVDTAGWSEVDAVGADSEGGVVAGDSGDASGSGFAGEPSVASESSVPGDLGDASKSDVAADATDHDSIAAQMAQRARDAIESADVVVQCVPADVPVPARQADAAAGPVAGSTQGAAVILVRTKADRVGRSRAIDRRHGDVWVGGLDAIAVSDRSKEMFAPDASTGLIALRGRIAAALEDRLASRAAARAGLLPRWYDAIGRAVAALEALGALLPESCERSESASASAVGDTRDPDAGLDEPEVGAELLRQAMDALGEVAGQLTPDDVLEQIFAGFCIGK